MHAYELSLYSLMAVERFTNKAGALKMQGRIEQTCCVPPQGMWVAYLFMVWLTVYTAIGVTQTEKKLSDHGQ